MSVEESKHLSLWEWAAMVHEFNLRQPKAPGQGDAGPPPTDAERAAWRESLRRGALPDERIPG